MTLDWLDRHAAFMAGYWLGKAERVTADVEDRARELLHDWALESLHLAKHFARHGPGFTRIVTESGERQ